MSAATRWTVWTLPALVSAIEAGGVQTKHANVGRKACCPICDDTRYRLAINVSDDGAPLFHCHANWCEFADIARALLPHTRLSRPPAWRPQRSHSLSALNLDELLTRFARGELRPDRRARVPELPKRAGYVIREVVGFFTLCQGLRLAAGGKRAIPFAVGWVTDHTGLKRRSVAKAIEWLDRHEVIFRDGRLPRVWVDPQTGDEYRQEHERPAGCIVKHPGARCYQLSDLRAQRNLPAAPRTVERSAGVAVVGSVEPDGQALDEPSMAETELPAEVMVLQERELGAGGGGARSVRQELVCGHGPDSTTDIGQASRTEADTSGHQGTA
jgi:hypothetical protein